MPISNWSTTAGDNDNADATINWLENQAPSTVNNSARAMMAAIRAQYEQTEWRDWGHTVAQASATTFTIAGTDVTSIYTAGRAIKCVDSSTLYGIITGSSFSTDTTVTVVLDSGSLTASLASVELGPEVTNPSISMSAIKWAKGADLASASALPVVPTANYWDVTGTTTITSIDSIGIGKVIKLHFDAALTLTHHATNLILPGGANITTAAGDEAEFIEYGSGTWRCTNYSKASISPTTIYAGHVNGFTISNNGTDPAKDIDITAGQAMDSTNAYLLVGTAMTKRMDASWVVGTNQGMLDGTESVAGTPDASTWYHIYAIRKDSDGSVDYLASESATSPTMPSGYTYFYLIDSIYMDATPDVTAFNHYRGTGGRSIMTLDVMSQDVSTTSPGTSAVTPTMTVPLGRQVYGIFNASMQNNSSAYTLVTSTDQTDTTPSGSAHTIYSLGTSELAQNQVFVMTNTSSQIRYRCSSASLSGSGLKIFTIGWES